MPIRTMLICLFFSGYLISCNSALNLTNNSSSVIVENVQFNQEDHLVTINFDIIDNSEDSRFYVQLMLEFENEMYYEINSESATGDIGPNITPGKKKKIIWDVLQDFPQGMKSEQVQFAINVQQQSIRSRRWIYVVSGILLLSAGVSAGILLRGGDQDIGLPPPPQRPGP